jgi:hypothetical protein
MPDQRASGGSYGRLRPRPAGVPWPSRARRGCVTRCPRLVPGVLVALSCLLVAGCGAGDRRQHVRGTVTLDGQPVEVGSLTFQPAEGNPALSAGGLIAKGSYDLPAQAGPMPGKYLVMFRIVRETGKTRTVAEKDTGKQTSEPEIVTVNIAQAAGIEATVTEGGPNKFDFQLTTAR